MIKNNIIILLYNINNQNQIELFISLRFVKKIFQRFYQYIALVLIFDLKKTLFNLSKNTFIIS